MTKKILWLKWKDIKNKKAGGAEVVGDELSKRLAKDPNFEILHITMGQSYLPKEEVINGVRTIRVGTNRYNVHFFAMLYYLKNLRGKYDIIIDEVNTAPFFPVFYKKKERVILFFHQLAREIWFLEAPILAPVFYFFEAIYLWILSLFNTEVIAMSESTKKDLIRFGFKEKNISIISEGISFSPLENLEESLQKEKNFTMLFFGTLRKMKRPMEALKAFEIFVKNYQDGVLWIAGKGELEESLKRYVSKKNIPNVVFWDHRPSDEEKLELMQKAHIYIQTSIKEGWGIQITEANALGTPAVSYNVDGVRDANKFGLISEKNTPESLANEMKKFYEDRSLYEDLRKKSWEFSKTITFEKSFEEFRRILNLKNFYE